MEKEKLENIRSFVNSDINSDDENRFTSKELQGYFNKKLKQEYADRLDQDFNIRKPNANSKKTKNEPNFIIQYLVIGVIGILLVLAIFFFLRNNNKEESNILMAYKNELYTTVDFNVRGNISNEQQLFIALNEAYEKKDFSQVIAEYQKLKSSDATLDLNVEQMTGIAYASLENYDQAENIFQGILSTQETRFSNHTTVRYLLGIVYLLKDDKPNAIEILQQIKEGDYKFDEAQTILKQL